MIDIKPSIILEDSKGSKYLFYYKDTSIYYREVSGAGDTKDTILISQANADFAAAIDTDDAVYLACSSRYKGILLFIYTNSGWKFEAVVNQHNSANIYIMDMVVQNGSIHIFFSKKLPVANMYNVYHIHKNINEQVPYIEYSWRKNSLSEIYSQNIESSFSILPLKGGSIHYASVWYDGTLYYINYYCFDDSIKSWIHKSLNISYKNQVSIKLISHNKKINLLSFSNESEASNIHHFLSKSSGSSEIDFKELNNSLVDTGGVIPLFYADDKSLQLAWIKDYVFHQYTLEDSSGKWKKAIDLPITAETNIRVIKCIRNTGSIAISKGYFILDKDYNILRPLEHTTKIAAEDKQKEKPQAEVSTEMNDYLKQILNEIKGLSENVQLLNSRIDNLESKTFVQKAPEAEMKELFPAKPKPALNGILDMAPLKKSNFKEKFMKSEKLPNYETLLLNQEHITTYVGRPGVNAASGELSKENEANIETAGNGKQAFSGSGKKTSQIAGEVVDEDSNAPYKYNSLFKKIGEFFK